MRKLFALLAAAFLLATPVLAAEEDAVPDDGACAHNFEVSVLREATCTEKGLLAYTCGKCGLTYTAETLPDGEHDYALTNTTATCTRDGEATYTCTRCGDTYTEAVTAAGHVPEKADATCTHAQHCAVCGQVLVPALGHSYVYQYDAQQDEDGSYITFGTWKCEICGRTMDATEGNALYYYSLPEEDRAQAASATDAGVIQLPDEYDSVTDAAPAADTADTADTGDGPDTASGSDTDAGAEQDQAADPNSTLWIVISAVLLIVIVAEAVALVRSLSKTKAER